MNTQATKSEGGFAASVVIAVVMALSFVGALAFGIWAFAGMQENQRDLDAKIASASAVAVQEAESAKDVEFAEELKNPFETYVGRDTYGSLTFDYPKTWSVYAEESTGTTILNFYGHPTLIPGLGRDVSFAFRGQILSSPFETEVAKFNPLATSGRVTVSAFRLEQVPDVLGARINGEITTGKNGTMILLPQRDKTIRLWTEFDGFLPDFEKLIQSTTFVP